MFYCLYGQDSTDSHPNFAKLNLNNELAQPEHRGQNSGAELPHVDHLNGKGKNLGSDLLESGCEEKVGSKKNGSSTEASSSMAEKDLLLAKTKTQMANSRQTQSGPLMHSTVLSHSLSERGRSLERFVMIHCDLFHEDKSLASVSSFACWFSHSDIYLVVWISGSWLVNYQE